MLQKSFLNRKKIILLILFLLVAMAGSYLCASVLTNQRTFYQGVSIEDYNLSGLSKEQALKVIGKRLYDAYGNRSLKLNYENQQWEYKLKDISYKFLAENTINQAFQLGRSGNPISRLSRIAGLRFNPMDFSIPTVYDHKKIYDILNGIKKEIEYEKKDAKVQFQNGKVVIEREVTGISLDIDKNLELVENLINKRNFDNIGLVVKREQPRIIYDSINEIGTVLGAFSTGFNPGDYNRSYNIGLACSKINGTVLLPNDVFSMNGTLGPRTVENGYRDAKVIYKDEYVLGAGGGVCQVSTTLYNTVLKAKLGIVERSHHSLLSAYVPAGQDATIAEDYLDLKFKNTLDYPVCINAAVSGNRINIRIYGKDSGERNIVKLKSEILATYKPQPPEYIIDNSIPNNETKVEREARDGLKVAVYRETYDTDGNLLSREKISQDLYKPIRAQIKINRTMYDTLFY